MKVIHRLVGYDRRTDQGKQRFDIPDTRLRDAKEIARVPDDDPDAVWSYRMSDAQARRVAKLVGGKLDRDAEFFLEAFADRAIRVDTALSARRKPRFK
jgi:hypothetical protein